MFSRTTIASSMSRPTQSESAIMVMVLMVKPNPYMKHEGPISAIGSVSPVMTVERQELRNRKMIRTVRAAPSNSVRFTFATETRIERELSRFTSSRDAGRRQRLVVGERLAKPVDHLDGVFALRLLHRRPGMWCRELQGPQAGRRTDGASLLSAAVKAHHQWGRTSTLAERAALMKQVARLHTERREELAEDHPARDGQTARPGAR